MIFLLQTYCLIPVILEVDEPLATRYGDEHVYLVAWLDGLDLC
ncbi:hypothetical protein KSX_89780 [Ktedonospora formicarum]|uniref:Uncharacterized protein n=1 Tax=Ktedonospora formicarum TaxID=2778364 RepID=A0A8J3MWX2_9CHLR|nr:hypothetical protein KSX_89780 [Ktedonospora formicarum]